MRRHRTTARLLPVLLLVGIHAGTANAAVPRLVFPVVAKVSYTDDFGAPRGSGSHEGNDIMAAKRSPVVAVEAGRVTKWNRSARAGCMLYLYGRSGTVYMYVHLNNDRTLANDNDGGCRNGIAYAPGLRSGQLVQPGQLVGFVGDSGDASGIASHLHFELHPRSGAAVSPYRRLRAAYRHLYQRPPLAVRTLRLRAYGKVVWARTGVEPNLLRVRVSRLRLSNGWWVRPARDATLTVPAAASIRQFTGGAETYAFATLAEATPGRRVIVWTSDFTNDRAHARAPGGLHAVLSLLLRAS
ncbi:MAG: M23 family metallopeptidase [Gaiellaceae bacterium]